MGTTSVSLATTSSHIPSPREIFKKWIGPRPSADLLCNILYPSRWYRGKGEVTDDCLEILRRASILSDDDDFDSSENLMFRPSGYCCSQGMARYNAACRMRAVSQKVRPRQCRVIQHRLMNILCAQLPLCDSESFIEFFSRTNIVHPTTPHTTGHRHAIKKCR